MKTLHSMRTLLFLATLLLSMTATASAQSGYLLAASAIAGGGSRMNSGSYVLTGTAGQADTAAIVNGGYALYGGFWNASRGVSGSPVIYLPIIVK